MAPHLLENTRNRVGNGRPDAERGKEISGKNTNVYYLSEMHKRTMRSEKPCGLVIVLPLAHLGPSLCEQMRNGELIVVTQY